MGRLRLIAQKANVPSSVVALLCARGCDAKDNAKGKTWREVKITPGEGVKESSRSIGQRALDLQQHGRLTPTPRASLHEAVRPDFKEALKFQRPGSLTADVHEEDKENLIDLAPFKFPFSKMSKTRSSEEKDREKDKEAGDNETEKETTATAENEEGNGKEATKDGNRERNMNDDNDTEDNARGEDAQLPVNQLQLATEPESNLKPSVFASNSFMPRNEPAIPSSAPPSYQHVIEQTRLEYAAEAQKHEEEKISAREASAQENRKKAPKILHKSSKQFYRAMAKQWGITCKMSDHCRCLDCQSRYFDCEYDTNQQTDGGLGAGAPMFISDVMQGSACVLL